MKVRFLTVMITLLLYFPSYSQSDLDKILKGGEILVNGLSFLKSNKTEAKSTHSKLIESVCVKNKLSDKITFRIVGKDEEGDDVRKELVIQKEGKECVFELPKGIYTHEIIRANKEIYKKSRIQMQ